MLSDETLARLEKKLDTALEKLNALLAEKKPGGLLMETPMHQIGQICPLCKTTVVWGNRDNSTLRTCGCRPPNT